MHKLSSRFACLIGFVALIVAPGCKTSDSNSAAQSIGAALAFNTSRSADARSADRAGAVEADLDPGYERYLYRLGQRRKARGMMPPPELRVAMRRQRYQSVIEMLTQAGSVAKRAIDPVARFIPYVNAGVVSKTALADPFAVTKTTTKTLSDAANAMRETFFRTP